MCLPSQEELRSLALLALLALDLSCTFWELAVQCFYPSAGFVLLLG